jgi:hypothetical protein
MTAALTATLSAHQKQGSRRPSLSVVATNKRGGIDLFRWQRVYAGPEADVPHALCVLSDGSVVRARNDSGTIRVQVVANPTSESAAWDVWTSLGAIATSGAGVSLATYSTGCLLAYVDSGASILKYVAYGGSWGSPIPVFNHGANVGYVAWALRSNGDGALFYTSGANVYRARYTSGTFPASGTVWTNSVASLTGLGACHDGSDFLVTVTGTAVTTTLKVVYACLMGDLLNPVNVWSALVTVTSLDSASSSAFAAPYVFVPGGADPHVWYSHRESAAPTYDRAFHAHPYHGAGMTSRYWSEPAPHDSTSAYGLAVASYDLLTVWASTAAGVFTCTIGQSSTLTTRVVALNYRLSAYRCTGKIVLDNADNGVAALTGLARGGSVLISPGYTTASGNEYGASVTLYVDSLEYTVDAAGRRLANVALVGPWEIASSWRAPQAWQSAAGALTRSQLFVQVAAKAALPTYAGSGQEAPSSAWTTNTPALSIAPGEDGASVLRRLLSQASDHVRADADGFTVVTPPARIPLAAAYGGSYADTVLQDSPSSYWRLGDSWGTSVARDELNAVAGTYTGNPKLECAALLTGDPGKSVRFNGSTAYVNFGDVYDFPGTAPFSVEAIIYLDTLPMPIHFPVYGKNTGAADGWSLIVNSTNNAVQFDRRAASAADTATGPAVLTTAGPHHIMATYDGATMIVYVNAVAGTPVASVKSQPGNANPLTSGRSSPGAFFGTGRQQELAVYPTALSAARVLAHYHAFQATFTDAAWLQPARYAHLDAPLDPNWARVHGTGVLYGQDQRPAYVYADGPRIAQRRALDGSSSALVAAYASAVMSELLDEREGGELRVPHDAARQLWDRVSVTSPRLGLTAQPYRVLAHALDFDRSAKDSKYDTVLSLGGA